MTKFCWWMYLFLSLLISAKRISVMILYENESTDLKCSFFSPSKVSPSECFGSLGLLDILFRMVDSKHTQDVYIANKRRVVYPWNFKITFKAVIQI